MSYGPENPRPQVKCGCGSEMKLDPARKPYGFICTWCRGCVDIVPPQHQHWQMHKCGVMDNGIRCGQPIPRGSVVCRSCERAISAIVASTRDGQKRLIALIGECKFETQLSIQEKMAAGAKRRAEQAELLREKAAKQAARDQEIGHVVYYARLGANHIKIGTTNRLRQRMVELRVVNVSNLLAAEPGGYKTEHERHNQFKKWRYNRRKEDFGEGPDLLEHIAAIRAEYGDPYGLAERMVA